MEEQQPPVTPEAQPEAAPVHYAIKAESLQTVLNYLTTRPWGEANGLIMLIQEARIVKINEGN